MVAGIRQQDDVQAVMKAADGVTMNMQHVITALRNHGDCEYMHG